MIAVFAAIWIYDLGVTAAARGVADLADCIAGIVAAGGLKVSDRVGGIAVFAALSDCGATVVSLSWIPRERA